MSKYDDKSGFDHKNLWPRTSRFDKIFRNNFSFYSQEYTVFFIYNKFNNLFWIRIIERKNKSIIQYLNSVKPFNSDHPQDLKI